MGTEQSIDAAEELAISDRASAAGDFEHAIDHLIRAMRVDGVTADIKAALDTLAARVAEAAAGPGPANSEVTGTLAGLFADTGEMARAVEWAQRTYDLAPEAVSSRVQLLAFTYKDTGDIDQLVQLADLARAEPDADDGLAQRMFAICCRGTMWLGHIPAPTDSLVSLAQNLLANGDYVPAADGTYDAPLLLKASALESPTASRTFAAVFPKAQLTVMDVPEPDIRLPIGENLTHRLWDYEDTTAVPRYPEPSPEAVATLHRVAADGWSDPLSVYARSAPLGELTEQDLLALLANVPPAPDIERWTKLVRRSPLNWPRIAQAWVCVGILHVRPEEPWPTSTRRAILNDVLLGPDDWSVDAAANAIATAAWNHPEVRPEAISLLMRRMLPVIEASHSRATELIEPLGELILSVPADDGRLREPVRDILKMYRALEEPPTPEEYTEAAVKQWGREQTAAASTPEKKRRLWRRS